MQNSDGLNVLLIQPPLPANSRHKKVLPLSLGYLAAYLRTRLVGINIEILDAQVLDMSYSRTVEAIFKHKRDIVGMTFWTAQAPFVYALAKAIRSQDSGIAIIFGGVHTTCCPEEAAEFADYCVLHEGEQTFCELIECMKNAASPDKIEGIAYIKDGEFIRTPPRPFINNLNELPFPAWDLLPIQRYDTPLHVVGGQRIPVIGSRGCPYSCSYCASPHMWQQKVRWRSPDNVVSEIKEIIEKYGIRQFHFWDDNLLMNKQYIEGLCNRIIDDKLDIKWVGITRGSHVTGYPEIMGLLKGSGCIGLEIGIESADPNTFLNIKKEEELGDLEEACRLQKDHGMHPLFTYMSLNPGENIATYYLQTKFIDKLLSGMDWYKFFHPLPFPVYIGQFCTPHVGTRLYKEAKDLGLVLANGWEEYNHHIINFIPHSLLNDVPQKAIKKLREDDYIVCTKAACYCMHDLYPHGAARWIQIRKQCGFIYFLSKFFAQCNGRQSIKEIAQNLSKSLNVDLTQSLRFCTIITIVLSQLGVIRPACTDIKIDLELKKIMIPDYFRTKWKYRILRLLARVIHV